MENEKLFHKIKHFVYIVFISIAFSLLSFGIITGGYTNNKVLSSSIQVNRTVEGFEKWESMTWKTILTKHNSWRQDKPKESADQKPIQPILIHKWFATGAIQQEYLNYAYKIWWENLVYLIMCENGWLDLDLQSRVVKNGKREESFWLCQISKHYYQDIVNNKRFFTDWKRQLDQCWNIRKNWWLFYGPTRKIQWKPCYIRASKQILYINKN